MPTVCAAVKLMWKFCESFKCETHALNTTGPAWRLSAPVSRPHTNSRSSQHPRDQLILEVRFKKPQFQLQYLNSKYGLQSGLGSHFDVCVQDPVVVSARRYSIFFKTHYDPTFCLQGFFAISPHLRRLGCWPSHQEFILSHGNFLYCTSKFSTEFH